MIVKFIIAGVFVMTQGLLLVLLLVVRYHFRMFSLPGDERALRLARSCTRGTLILMAGAFIAFVWIMAGDIPEFPRVWFTAGQ